MPGRTKRRRRRSSIIAKRAKTRPLVILRFRYRSAPCGRGVYRANMRGGRRITVRKYRTPLVRRAQHRGRFAREDFARLAGLRVLARGLGSRKVPIRIKRIARH